MNPTRYASHLSRFRAVLMRSSTTRQPRMLALAGGMALGAGGYVHLCLYRHGYRSIPVIGKMFAANVVTSSAIAVAVLFRRELVVRLAGVAVAAGTLLAFGLSRTAGGLFDFQERGLRPAPQAPLALAAELVAFAALAATVLWDLSPGLARIPTRRDELGRSSPS